jgi:DtxR family Mn-dependent transcriptional regulator
MENEIDFQRGELLEMLWHLSEKHELKLSVLREHDPTNEFEKALYNFTSNGILNFDGENISFTEKGKDEAKGIIRRHRLAECLLSSVLGKKPAETEQAACEFEHILSAELVDSICILLGHPPKCPHGDLIPQGECCTKAKSYVKCAVIPVTKMKVGSSAKIAFLNTHDDCRSHKLFNMGLNPGSEIKLHQTYPAIGMEAVGNMKGY